ncbi:phospholipase D-like domain-containing protein [Halosimplex salinum]|uniref:phospholipase D-like domain-containing protein n=1 Tax=Halosimplex salinum TaxID=1710538 RepID=UPI000F46E757|nr:phospholipase D-like domain-containing protein [Halosimplex salinum]
MTRSSNELAYFIGYTLIHADRVVLVSPWLSDVELRFPVNDQISRRELLLSEAVAELTDTDITFLINGTEDHNDYIKSRVERNATIVDVPDLHAKAVITDDWVYAGSANITRRGLLINRELCKIVTNDHNDADTYVQEEIHISL